MRNYYHVKTQEAYDSLMAFLEASGCKWNDDDKPTEVDVFYVYEEKTVIEVDENKEMTFGSTPFYESVLKVPQLVEWTPELAKSVYFCITSATRGIVDSVCSLLDILEKKF
ncbi:hypothetical protein ENFAE_02260 [Enterococcus faecalis]|nr:hypothetical protein [Enterococcus faecalis]OFA14567.1 hypothetical protein ENFAE_02260 [Enterococcus faecalis]